MALRLLASKTGVVVIIVIESTIERYLDDANGSGFVRC